MEDLALFNSLYIVEEPKFYDNGNTVEFRVVKSDDKSKIPGMFKLRCHKKPHIATQIFMEGFSNFVRGDIVTACGTSDAYRSKFCGKQGKPVKASNGKWYYVNRNRFYIIKIKKGAHNPIVIQYAFNKIAGYVNELEERKGV